MKVHHVVFTPEARDQLVAIYQYIAKAASAPEIAARYTEAIVAHCERLSIFPMRGSLRNDIRPGLRLTHYRKRTVIVYSVDERQVSIIGVYYGGQDYEAVLGTETDE